MVCRFFPHATYELTAETGRGTDANPNEQTHTVFWLTFDRPGSREVCSIICNTNIPSNDVAIRNGMTVRDHWVMYYCGVDMPHDRYVVER